MQNWDNLGLSWNAAIVLGCLPPIKAEETAVVNTRRILFRTSEPWQSVHLKVRMIFFISKKDTTIWDKVFKNGPMSSTNFTWSILE